MSAQVVLQLQGVTIGSITDGSIQRLTLHTEKFIAIS